MRQSWKHCWIKRIQKTREKHEEKRENTNLQGRSSAFYFCKLFSLLGPNNFLDIIADIFNNLIVFNIIKIMRKIILASNNPHKIKEFKEIFSDAEILSLSDIGYTEDIIEN